MRHTLTEYKYYQYHIMAQSNIMSRNVQTGRFPTAPFGLATGLHVDSTPGTAGKAASGMQRSLVKRLGSGLLCNDTPLSSGPVKIDWRSVLESPTACNNIVALHMGADDKLLNSPLSTSFNLFYSPRLVPELYNEIIWKIIHAAPIVSDDKTPSPQSIVVVDRPYVLTKRGTGMVLPPAVVEAIQQLALKIHGTDVFGGRNNRPDSVDANADNIAEMMLAELEALISEYAGAMKASLDKGITREAYETIVRTAVPLALCAVMERHATSIASEVERTNDMNAWKRSELLRNQIVEEYVNEHVRRIYALPKDPAGFLNEFIERGTAHLQNLTTRETRDRNTVILPQNTAFEKVDDPFEAPNPNFLAGVITVSEHMRRALSHIAFLKHGTRVTRKPIYLQPGGAFRRDHAANRDRVAMIYDDTGNPIRRKASGQSAIDIVMDSTPSGTARRRDALVRLTKLGEKVFGEAKYLPDEADEKVHDDRELTFGRQSDNRLYDVTMTQPCIYIDTSRGAFVVDTSTEEVPKPGDLDPGASYAAAYSPSMVHMVREMMRVSVGDLNTKNQLHTGWARAVTDHVDDKVSYSPSVIFGTPSVETYTPGVELKRYEFGPLELNTALLQPHLYRGAEYVEALNANLRAANAITNHRIRPLRQLYENHLKNARDRDKLFEQYATNSSPNRGLNNLGETALEKLITIEKIPFYDVTAKNSDAGKYQFGVVRRIYYGEIPDYAMSRDVALIRGARLLAEASSKRVLTGLADQLESAATAIMNADVNVIDFTNHKSIASRFRQMLGNLYAGYEEHKNINPLLYDDTGELIFKFAMVPVLTTMRFKYEGKSIQRATDMGNMFTFYDTLKPHEGDRVMNKVMNYNVFRLATAQHVSVLQRIAAIIQMFTYITPYAIHVTIETGTHLGFAVDFLRLQSVYSDTMILTTPHSHDMIVTGGDVRVDVCGDGAVRTNISCNMQTINNMVSGGGVAAMRANPNPQAASMASRSNGRPTISIDTISRSKEGRLSTIMSKMENAKMPEIDRRTIEGQLKAQEYVRISRAQKGISYRREDEFVALLRPVHEPTHHPEPFMGRPRHLAVPLPGTIDEPFVRFCSSAIPTKNPYCSELDSLYQLLYRHNHTLVGPRDDAFRTTTLCHPINSAHPVCSTTLVLEQMFHMDSGTHEMSLLPPTESAALTNFCAAKSRLPNMRLDHVPYAGTQTPSELGEFDVAVRFGLSLPYTHMTDNRVSGERAQFHPEGNTVVGDTPVSHLVISPFSVPHEMRDPYVANNA